jgi:hypothetical protein
VFAALSSARDEFQHLGERRVSGQGFVLFKRIAGDLRKVTVISPAENGMTDTVCHHAGYDRSDE